MEEDLGNNLNINKTENMMTVADEQYQNQAITDELTSMGTQTKPDGLAVKFVQSESDKDKLNNSSINFNSYIRQAFNLPDTDIKTYSPLTLAFIGDSVFDLIVRTYVVGSGNAPVNKLHHRCSKLVQAGAQAQLYHLVKDKLSEEEMAVFKRGRNAKSFTTAKNAGLLEYKTATGMEALIGYLYLTGRIDRIMELMQLHLSGADADA